MQQEITENRFEGSIQIPPSKSYFQRQLLLGALTPGKVIINGISQSRDGQDLIAALIELGVDIEENKGKTFIYNQIESSDNLRSVTMGESGLASRMIIPVLAAIGGVFIIKGTGSLNNRSFDPILELLKDSGIEVKSNDGKLPIRINGKLKAGNYTISGAMSSQFASGLFLALPMLQKESTLELLNPNSLPYIGMTLDVLEDFGGFWNKIDENKFQFTGNEIYSVKKKLKVEGDWSSASFWIVAALISGQIKISGLQKNSLQADSRIMNLLSDLQVNYSWQENLLTVRQSSLRPFSFDATHCPDLFPPLAALAATIEGETKIKGGNRLLHKESNRAQTLQSEFQKLDVPITLEDDVMHIHGQKNIKTAKVSAHNDHRIAMALAVTGLKADETINIEGAESVEKSYLNFWKDWQRIAFV